MFDIFDTLYITLHEHIVRRGQIWGLLHHGILFSDVQFYVHDVNVSIDNNDVILLECIALDDKKIQLFTIAAGHLNEVYYHKTCEINKRTIDMVAPLCVGMKFYSFKSSFGIKFKLLTDKTAFEDLSMILGYDTKQETK